MAKAKSKAKAPKIKPLGDRVVVKRLEAEEKTTGGIVLPEAAKEKPKQGEVVAVGEGRMGDEGDRVPMSVSVGDRIVFASYAGTEVSLGDEDYLIMREEDVLAIVKTS
jgi:chaperonin GroES